MTERSGIEWTEATWNPITGCSKVSAGCKNCYAETIAERFWGERKFTDVICHEDRLDIPLRWRKPRRIFVNSMSDLFHEKVPFEFIDRVFAVMIIARRHTFQLLTKRPDRMLAYCSSDATVGRLVQLMAKLLNGLGTTEYADVPDCLGGIRLSNLWLGVSIEDQKTASERLLFLAQTPAAVRWVSIEPLLAPVSLRWLAVFHENAPYTAQRADSAGTNELDGLRRFDWVVCGGESGPHARPMNPDWARTLRDQCQEAGVAFFMKQMGGHPNKRGKLEEIPEDLRIRQYPEQEEG